jgi:hypothetical protein
MKDFLQTLQDAFPVLKTHPVLMARLFLAATVLTGFWAAKGLRRKIFWPLCAKMYDRVAVTSRYLFVFHNGDLTNNWKYYTSEVTGKGDTGDDMIWTLVRWPSLKPIDSFRLAGVVGMGHALHESTVKLEGRWKIIHDPYASVGPLPARGPISKLRRACARVLLALSGGPAATNKVESSAIAAQ